MSETYGEGSIDKLEGAERIRTRPASMLGSNGLEGAQHGVIELFGNASDEAKAGYGARLDFKRYADGSLSIRDYGRGVPLGWNEDKKMYNWHIIYNELYGGAKYENHQTALKAIEDWSTFDSTAFNYLYSVGLNGLGAAATQYTSEFFDVTSIREGADGQNQKYEMHFLKGLPVIDGEPINVQRAQYDFTQYQQEVVDTDEPTGTFIHWKPDKEVFSDVNITAKWLLDFCNDEACVSGMHIHFEDEDSGEVYDIEPSTLEDLLLQKYSGVIKDEENIIRLDDISHGEITVEGKPFVWVSECSVVMTPTVNATTDMSTCYHNSIKMRQGVQYDAVTNAVFDVVKTLGNSEGVRVVFDDCRGAFAVVVSSYANYASVRNQTKDAVEDGFMYDFIYNMIYQKLSVEYNKGTKMVVDAIRAVIERANMRIQIKEATKQIREMNKIRNKVRYNPDKYVTCREFENKDYHRTELWITEGDSAKGAVVAARDSDFQAVIPIRGKGLNVFKATIARILKNKEIRDIFTLLGTGIDLSVKGEKFFNIDDLRFDKIVFATDSDVDGYQIRVLLFALFYRLAPQLITEGHVFIAETPRFGVVLNDGSRIYALDDAERDKLLEEYSGRVRDVQRYKGLGEVDADVLSETTVSPDTRRLIPIDIDLGNEVETTLIDALFGADKYKQRKNILIKLLGSDLAENMERSMEILKEIEASDIDDGIEVEEWA